MANDPETMKPYLKVIPLGGVGDFGANATLFQTDDTSILVDYGLMFPPDARQPGVDYYVLDPDELLDRFPNLAAIFVTHGHEDHIGGLPFLLKRHPLPIYTMPYTAQLIRQKVPSATIHEVTLDASVTVGGFEVQFVGVTHSIVQACALAIKANGQTVVHSGDFKVDALPGDDYPFEWTRFKQLGEQGVDLLIMDSTNAHKPGFCPSDAEIVDAIEDHIRQAKGRVFFTTFSSHIPRLKKLKHIAHMLDRKIVLLGRSFIRHYMASLDAAYLAHAPDIFVSAAEAETMPDESLIFVVTGSQGERASALVKLTHETFQGLGLKAGDTVIFSSRTIPGNERVIALLISELENKGVHVVTASKSPVHTSGHGYREDAAYLFALTQPKHVIPIHGEFNFLLRHYQWLKPLLNSRQQAHLIQNGDVVVLKAGSLELAGQSGISLIPIDGNQNLPLPTKTIRERKDMMYSGLIVISACVYPQRVQVRCHGLVEEREGDLADDLAAHLHPQVTSAQCGLALKRAARRFLRGRFFGRPKIIVLVDGQFT
ncbi:MAG: ribonuclease J [Acidobacteria bacterium]|nr:ribonuclease J [Acidobacteriota bacterium]